MPVLIVGRVAEMEHYFTLRQTDSQQSIIYLKNLVGVLGRKDQFEKLKCACLKVHPRKNNMEPENVPLEKKQTSTNYQLLGSM